MCFLLKILSRKPSFLKIIWSTGMMSLYSIVTQLVRAWSFYIHWWCLPCFICHEILKTLLEANKIAFSLYIFHFSICLSSNKLYWIEDQLADVSTRFYTSASWRWRVGVGELNRRRLDWIPFKKPIHFTVPYVINYECKSC